MAARAKGDFQVKRLKARTRKSAERKSYVIPYVGPYTALVAQEPEIGSVITGFPSDYKVTEVTIEEGRSTEGRMTVTIEKPQPGNNPSNDNTPLSDPVYESDYAEERRPTETHKKCGYLKADRPYYEYPDRKTSAANPKKTAGEANSDVEKVYKQRTWDNWQSLDTDDYALAAVTNRWSLEQYKSLKEKGYNDYPVSYPLCTATTYHRARPQSGQGTWKISAPPSECDPPPGFIYVKCADRGTKQARLFTRIQQWRGYDSTDELFFL